MKKMIKNPKVLFPLLMANIMAFFMTFIILVINRGFCDSFLLTWVKNFLIAMPIAFVIAYFMAPKIRDFVDRVCED